MSSLRSRVKTSVFGLALSALLCAGGSAGAADEADSSPPPMRPLPVAADRPMEPGPAYYVDGAKGNDSNAGSEAAPFKSISRGLSQLRPGDTLYIRGGIYYEHLQLTGVGQNDKPITIRAYPRELVIVDGGLRDFAEHPEAAWVPCPGGADGEFWSARTYEADGGTRPLEVPGAVNVLGRFADTMVPLHGYWTLADLRTSNELWTLADDGRPASAATNKGSAPTGRDGKPQAIYSGPGIAYDPATKRIHIRLAHTNIKGIDDNYRGELDPRKLHLAISTPGSSSTMTIDDCRNVFIEDIVFRGARGPTLGIVWSQDIQLDGISSYGGSTCIRLDHVQRFKATRSAFRGLAAPWTFRSSLKYRSIEAQLFSASAWEPNGNAEFEVEHCDFTDSIDGIFIGSVQNMNFHHNFVENLSDDCIFLTANTDYEGKTSGGNIHIHQNYIGRTLTSFAFGVGHGRQKLLPTGRQTGSGVWIYRNVFDYRQWIPYFPHHSEDETTFEPAGKSNGDHGSPTWEPMWFYQNTIIAGQGAFRDGYLNGWGSMGMNSPRRVLNNIYVQTNGIPGLVFGNPKADLEANGNLHWGLKEGPTFAGDFFAKFRGSRIFAEVKALHATPWAANDVFADPKFSKLAPEPLTPTDLRLVQGSPAIDAGVPIPAEWPDPLRAADPGKPDIGAIPFGVQPWTVGLADVPISGR